MLFENPKLLLLLILIVPLYWFLRKSRNRTLNFATTFRSVSPAPVYFRLKMVLSIVFISSMIVVAAGSYTESARTGDYIILVDVSRSMDARQSCGDPTFLDRSRNVMRTVLDGVPEGRFSIFIFDRFAFPVTQMTNNQEYLNQVIEDGIHIGMTFEATKTELANALSVISDKRGKLPEIYGSVRHIILLSDGFVSGDYRRRFSEPLTSLRNAGVKVMAVGVGNPGQTPILLTEQGQCKAQQIELDGEVVFIQLRDDVLKFIASETQGQYYSEGDIKSLVEDLRQGLGMAAEEGSGNTGTYRRDISIYFLVLATLSLLGLIVLGANLRFKALLALRK